ncbi:MAG: hypothetical protein FWC89_12915 [Defluviitaleaceae bacterium]|nr:hypothetical protein [Defluviitaleaceae bacterium]
MKKFALVVVSVICVILAACAGGTEVLSMEDNLRIDTSEIISHTNVEAAPLIDTRTIARDENNFAVERGANDFAFALGSALLEDVGTDNFIVSPYSVWLPLAALINAAHEDYRPALIEILAAEGLDVATINQATSRMLFDLTNERSRLAAGEDWYGSPLQIANAVLVNNRYTINTEFAQTFADYFRGEAIAMDFASPNAVVAINQWASDNTNGRITNVLEEIDPNTAVAIANAIYFTGSWINEFNPDNTSREIFHSPTGDVYAYFMRRNFHDIMYFEDERMQSLAMHFYTGGTLRILLPHDGDAVGLLSDMTAEQFEAIGPNSVRGSGRLVLPRFSIESKLNLVDALTALGLGALFCETTAPLTNLIYHPYPCFLSNAVQVATIEVDEEGATAAAVTIIEAVALSYNPDPIIPFEMICDRPFAFVLSRHLSGGGQQILFTGVVNQP